MGENQAIVAIATATGRGAIGIVRISGKDLSTLLFALTGKKTLPRQAYLQSIRDHQGEVIDTCLVIFFPTPNSYTGEDILEIQAHGGPIVLQRIVARIQELGVSKGIPVRLARPGEFTERAFLNDKLDLTQAEAVSDLINAQTEQAAKSASRTLKGVFSENIQQFSEQFTKLRIVIEASLDFPEEEIEHLQRAGAISQLQNLQSQLQKTLQQTQQGVILREGVRVVIAGQPNVGKSSLLNCLAGSDVAIVTSVAGTTRDKIEQTITIDGIPLHIIDTAGLRSTQDEVEQIGVSRSWQQIEQADLILFVHDVSRRDNLGYQTQEGNIGRTLPTHIPLIHIWNKIDLVPNFNPPKEESTILISCDQRIGLDDLRQKILKTIGWYGQTEGLFLARKRHIDALQLAKLHVDKAYQQLSTNPPILELSAEDLRLAQQALGEITGEFTSDDLLGKIFSSFCIGK
jgi:tRNA modification GTPase